jgi:hypothetical protein
MAKMTIAEKDLGTRADAGPGVSVTSPYPSRRSIR